MDCQHPCPRYERAMNILGKKWTCLILRCLMGETRRFTEISAYVHGLSDRLLLYSTREYKKTRVRYFVEDEFKIDELQPLDVK